MESDAGFSGKVRQGERAHDFLWKAGGEGADEARTCKARTSDTMPVPATREEGRCRDVA